jgi:hypothetical protein
MYSSIELLLSRVRAESNKSGWLLFKLTSPYILLVFLLFMFSYL